MSRSRAETLAASSRSGSARSRPGAGSLCRVWMGLLRPVVAVVRVVVGRGHRSADCVGTQFSTMSSGMSISIREYRPDGPRCRCRELWRSLIQRHRDIYEDPTIGGPDARPRARRLPRAARPASTLGRGRRCEITSSDSAGSSLHDEESELEPIVVDPRASPSAASARSSRRQAIAESPSSRRQVRQRRVRWGGTSRRSASFTARDSGCSARIRAVDRARSRRRRSARLAGCEILDSGVRLLTAPPRR